MEITERKRANCNQRAQRDSSVLEEETKKSNFHAPLKKKLDANENVPMLTFGPRSNFVVFQDSISTACLEKYGDPED